MIDLAHLELYNIKQRRNEMKSAIEEIMFGRRTTDSVIPTAEMKAAFEKENECEDKLLALLQDIPDGKKVYK